METINVDDRTAATIRFAAETAGISPGEVIRRLVERSRPASEQTAREPGTLEPDVAIYALYDGRRTQARYEPTTRRVIITDGPLEGRAFKSPSGAAIAVVSHYHPGVNPNRNGWTFWTLSASGELLQSLRRP